MWQIIKEYIRSIISILSIYYLGKTIVNSQKCKTNKKIIIIISIIAIAYTIICLYTTGIIKTLLLSSINTIFYNYIFKISLLKSLLIMFIYTIISIIVDLLSLFALTEILGYSKYFCYEVYAGSIIGNLIVCFFIVIIAYILRKTFRKIINAKISSNVKIVVLSMITLISILLFFYAIVEEFEFSNNVIMYLVAICIIIFTLSSLIKQILENAKLVNEYDNLLECMTTYEIDIENERILRHESKNELRTIRAMIFDNQKHKQIIEYIDEIVNDKYEVKKEKYAKFGYLPPNGIKGLFYFKTQEAENKGIKVSINISKKIKNSTLYNLNIKQQRDFGRILGVFLDNAIEASLESKVKQLGIEAYVNKEKEIKIIISNTYNNIIEKSKLGMERFSTKGKTRGRGLLLVKGLIEKNSIFEIKNNIQNNIYIQTIIIKNNQ